MAALPSYTDLNEMAQAIGGCDFEQLPPENRVQIMQLCIANETAAILDSIDSRLSHVAHWFELSKLWEGEVWARS